MTKKLTPDAGEVEGPKISSKATERILPTQLPKINPVRRSRTAEQFFRSDLVDVLRDLRYGSPSQRAQALNALARHGLTEHSAYKMLRRKRPRS